jgi:hypothetical protein
MINNLAQTKLTNPQGRGRPFKGKVSNSVYTQLLVSGYANVSAFNYLSGKLKTLRFCDATGHIRERWQTLKKYATEI